MEKKTISMDNIFWDGVSDVAYRKTYLGDWGPDDDMSDRTYAAGPEWTPWDDPFKDAKRKAENTIAVCGYPDMEKPGEPVKVYYHDRWAGKPWNVLADEAVELLRDKKGVDIRVMNKQMGYDGVLMSYDAYRNNMRVESEVLLKPEIFDRMEKTEIDRQAGLKNELDTHTYILLRIAYVLFQVYKIDDDKALRIHTPIVSVFKHTAAPVYRF